MMLLGAGALLGWRTLILGETGSGKSVLLFRILSSLAESCDTKEITLIDMAPSRSWGVGGKLSEIGKIPEGVRYHTSWDVTPPRLVGRTAEEVLSLALKNRALLEPFVSNYLAEPTPILMINDASIYAHGGDPGPLLKALGLAKTWIVTAYSGERLAEDKGASVTLAERRFVNSLIEAADRIIRMG